MAAIDHTIQGYPREIRSSRRYATFGREATLERVFLCGGTAEDVRMRRGTNAKLPRRGHKLLDDKITQFDDQNPIRSNDSGLREDIELPRMRVDSIDIRQLQGQQLCEVVVRYATYAISIPFAAKVEWDVGLETVTKRFDWQPQFELLDENQPGGLPFDVPVESFRYVGEYDGVAAVENSQVPAGLTAARHLRIRLSSTVNKTNKEYWLDFAPNVLVCMGVVDFQLVGEARFRYTVLIQSVPPLGFVEHKAMWMPERGMFRYHPVVDESGARVVAESTPRKEKLRDELDFNEFFPLDGTYWATE